MHKPQVVKSVNELLDPQYGLSYVANERTRFLILGTFPAQQSIDTGFYYQNQIKRSFYIDDVLYTVSDHVIMANDLANLVEIKNVELDS